MLHALGFFTCLRQGAACLIVVDKLGEEGDVLARTHIDPLGCRWIIGFQLCGHKVGGKLAIQKSVAQIQEGYGDRYTQHHADDTKEITHDGDGQDNTKGAESGGIAGDEGIDDIGVDLLNDQHQNDEGEELTGLGDEYQKSAGDSAEDRSEEGDDVGRADDKSDENRIGNVGQGEGQRRYDDDECRVGQLADDVVTEGLVGVTDEVKDVATAALMEECGEQTSDLCGKTLLGCQRIAGDEQADYNVNDQADDVYHVGGCDRGEIIQKRAELFNAGHTFLAGQEGENVFNIQRGDFKGKMQVFNQLVDIIQRFVDVGRQVLRQILDAGGQLRQEEHDENNNKQDDNGIGKEHGNDFAQRLRLLFPCEDAVMKEIEQGIGDIRDQKTDGDRSESRHQHLEKIDQMPAVDNAYHKQHEEQIDTAEDGPSPCQLEFLFILPVSFGCFLVHVDTVPFY